MCILLRLPHAVDWNKYDIPPLLAAEHTQCVKEHSVLFCFFDVPHCSQITRRSRLTDGKQIMDGPQEQTQQTLF